MLTDLDVTRFWSKVEKSDGCWPWLGGRTPSGYGQFKAGGKTLVASRVALELEVGGLSAEEFACHGCDNPPCVRVGDGHIFKGDALLNIRDMDDKGRGKRAGKGEAHHAVVLTEDQVREIVRRYRSGEKQRALATLFGVGQMEISRIVRGLRWGHLNEGERADGRRRNTNAHSRKLTDAQESEIRKRKLKGERSADLASEFGVSLSLIWLCVNTSRHG